MNRKPWNMLCALLALVLMLSAVGGVATVAEPKQHAAGEVSYGDMAVTPLADPPLPESRFTDIEGHWAQDAIGVMVERGYMQGTFDTTFEPNLAFSRAMAVTILYRMAGEPETSSALVFTDVEPGQWYSDAVAWAHNRRIMRGVGDNQFAPAVNITRQELATILHRFAESQGHDIAVTSSTKSNFPDANLIDEWAETAMDWAVYSGLMRGTDLGTLNPRGNATRAEAAMVLMRFIRQFPPPLCSELEVRIKESYLQHLEIHHPAQVAEFNITVHNIHLFYFGTYSNGVVVIMNAPGTPSPVPEPRPVIVGEYTFFVDGGWFRYGFYPFATSIYMRAECALKQGLLSQEEFSDFARRVGGVRVE